MSKELVCPFCNKKLEPIGTSGQFQCGTWGCDASFNFIATKDVWEYIGRTRKALDVAKYAIKDNLSQANFTQMLDASRFHCIRTKCEFALAEITALEQKDK